MKIYVQEKLTSKTLHSSNSKLLIFEDHLNILSSISKSHKLKC